jgi:hypothetical protein
MPKRRFKASNVSHASWRMSKKKTSHNAICGNIITGYRQMCKNNYVALYLRDSVVSKQISPAALEGLNICSLLLH